MPPKVKPTKDEEITEVPSQGESSAKAGPSKSSSAIKIKIKKSKSDEPVAAKKHSPEIQVIPADVVMDPRQRRSSTAKPFFKKGSLKADKPLPSRGINPPPDEIFERGVEHDPIASQIQKLQEAKAPLGQIFEYHFDHDRSFTHDLRKRWLNKINELRRDRSLTSVPAEYETEASEEVAYMKFTDGEISSFWERLENDWNVSKSLVNLPREAETSSDSEVEDDEKESEVVMNEPEAGMKEPEVKLPPEALGEPKPLDTPKKPSWKEFKKGKNFGSAYFKYHIKHLDINNLMKTLTKTIWRKKKQHYISTNESCSIEVDQNEVQKFFFRAVGFMEKRYLGQIKRAALHILPTGDDNIFENDFESGTYDSDDDFYPNNESISSKMNKMSVSVPPSTLNEYGLLDLLIATLPMTLNYNDPAETLEFVEILKLAKNRVPEQISFKSVPTGQVSDKKRPISGSTIICKAHVEPPPDLERLERLGAKGYLKELPSEEGEKSETESSSNGEKLVPRESVSEPTIMVDSVEASGIHESPTKANEDLLQPETGEQLKRRHSPQSPDSKSKKKTHEE